MAGLLGDFDFQRDGLFGGGGLLGRIGGGLNERMSDPLMQMGLIMATSNNPQEGLKAGLPMFNAAQQRRADAVAYQALAAAFGGQQQQATQAGAPTTPRMPAIAAMEGGAPRVNPAQAASNAPMASEAWYPQPAQQAGSPDLSGMPAGYRAALPQLLGNDKTRPFALSLMEKYASPDRALDARHKQLANAKVERDLATQTFQQVETPDGKRLVKIDPTTGAASLVPIPGVTDQVDTTHVPPGVDPQKYKEERAKNAANQERDIAQRGDVAERVMPQIDRAIGAYGRLAQRGSIGPAQASSPWRTVQGSLGAQSEIDRQDYEAAAKELELAKAQISMKGQGQITESERRLLALTLPRLDAADASVGMKTLNNWRQTFSQDAARGGAVRANESMPASNSPLMQQGGLPKLSSEQQYMSLPSGTRFVAPDGSVRVKP